jgi:hypothetical protein
MTKHQRISDWKDVDIIDPYSTHYIDRIHVADIVMPQRSAGTVLGAIATCMLRSQTGLYASDVCDTDAIRLGTTNLVCGGDVTRARVYTPNVTLGTGQFTSTSPFAEVYTRLVRAVPEIQCISASETLLRLRAHFSLNTSELARVLGVERPTIYSWTKDSVVVRERHRARLASLSRLVNFWTRLSPRPLGPLKHATSGDSTVLDWLADSSASENTICQILREVSEAASTAKTPSKMKSIAEIARERGWSKVPVERSEQTARSLHRRQST